VAETTRFDLEEAIMACWHTSDDVTLLAEKIADDKPTEDSVLNTLQGIKELHDLRCQKLFKTFELLVASRDIK
jgi:hypothetical protein